MNFILKSNCREQGMVMNKVWSTKKWLNGIQFFEFGPIHSAMFLSFGDPVTADKYENDRVLKEHAISKYRTLLKLKIKKKHLKTA